MDRIKIIVAVLGLTIAFTGCNSAKQDESVKSNNSSEAEIVTEEETNMSEHEDEPEECSETDTKDVGTNSDTSEPTFSEDDTTEQIAEKIEEKYGVDIVYGEDIRTVYEEEDETLKAEKYTDDSGIRKALAYVDEALGVFPQGLTEQLISADGSPMKIYLTGTISSDAELFEDGGIPAFANKNDTETYLSIDISPDGEINVPTVCHELTHIIDLTMTDMGTFSESKWGSLNPKGFSYTENYETYRDCEFTDKYCYASEKYFPRTLTQDADDVYFYYNYALTFAMEDRATLMEDLIVYMMWGYEIAPGLYSFPHVHDKAQYFLEAVRDSFDLNEEDVNKWQTSFEMLSAVTTDTPY
ncbi:hypothetical protein [Ruminococcus albus]|uniref:Uncharacterized protein n=1 Tax=Ruminococcus albus TaxID=1264 RepID=A0A1I1MTK2_RUMAL|nr:hypothetical protein [Ruminococcus albus]SFC88465.1 hypothetical protein SAMN02910406_02574 [Ruminococcus albus]